MSSSNKDVLNDIRGKIEREKKLIQGFQNLRKKTNNAEVIQRCNTQIRETQSNIDYLQSTLAKMSMQLSDNLQSENSDSKRNSLRPMYTRFDLIKYDCPSLGHRIQYMLQQIQFKLQVENQYREANKKISHLYLMDGDKSSSVAAEGGKLESDQRIQLLNKALKRYQDMHVDVLEVTRDMEIMNTPKYARKPLTGKLNITITCIRDLDHIASPAFTRRPESVVCIKIDDVERARTHGSRSGKWNEEFSIDVDKGHEIELCVYDKSGQNRIPVALTWALLSDITEELRKKRVDNELGKENWVSANSLSTSKLPSNENLKVMGNIPNLYNSTNNVTQGIAQGSSDISDSKIQISSWLNLEPVGQILVSMSFEKSNRTVGSHFMGGLGRHGAIKQKKEEVFEQHGHQFVQKQFYNIMCCALCGEFLRYTGFQCQDCKFLCHKKCYQKVVTKCISKTSNDTDDAAKLNHRIPHRFDPILNRGTKWCCHCGYILPWGRKNVRKCTECGVMCHAHCVHLVPDFCGMSMEMANQILTTIKSTKPQVKQQKSLPFVPGVAQLQPETTKHSATTSDTKFTRSENASDDEEDVHMKLPTEVNNEYQEQAKSPFDRSSSRRAPPNAPIVQPQYKEQFMEDSKEDLGETRNQHDYTFMSNKSDELQTYIPNDQQILDPINESGIASGIQERNNFEGFDYENSQNNMIALNQDLTNQKPPLQQVEPSNNLDVPVVHTKSSHKSKRRRRKIGLDDFQFLAVLGKGNFGKVMLAESRHTQNLCAIKVLKKDFIVENDEADSVKSEKRVFLTANKEMHPFLLNLHCCFQTENRIYFVMEYISGGDLMWHIQKSRFSAKRAKFYACEVLLALKYFHDNGIVYRDLKLDNILLTTKGHIKIADYGLCKDKMWYKNTTGTFCGTPEFMAPEIVAGKPYDRSVDWWAFGVLLFQMLLCQSPFKGDDEDEIFNAIEHDDVKYPISMPRQTVLVLQALLTKDPAERLGSSERDAEEIMEHPYFSDVDFDDVLNCRIQAPYLPEITSEHDYSNFDQEFTSETPRLTPVETVLTSEMQEQFRGFSHIADGAAI